MTRRRTNPVAFVVAAAIQTGALRNPLVYDAMMKLPESDVADGIELLARRIQRQPKKPAPPTALNRSAMNRLAKLKEK